MDSDKALAYSSDKAYKVELIKRYLADHGIISFSINKQDSNYHFGEIELYVNSDDVMRAKLLIGKFES